MKEFDKMGSYVLDRLGEKYEVKPMDIGSDAQLSKKGMHFFTRSYEIKDLGHLCIMTMNAMMGLMQMETVVLSVTGKDIHVTFNGGLANGFRPEGDVIGLTDLDGDVPLQSGAIPGGSRGVIAGEDVIQALDDLEAVSGKTLQGAFFEIPVPL